MLGKVKFDSLPFINPKNIGGSFVPKFAINIYYGFRVNGCVALEFIDNISLRGL